MDWKSTISYSSEGHSSNTCLSIPPLYYSWVNLSLVLNTSYTIAARDMFKGSYFTKLFRFFTSLNNYDVFLFILDCKQERTTLPEKKHCLGIWNYMIIVFTANCSVDIKNQFNYKTTPHPPIKIVICYHSF